MEIPERMREHCRMYGGLPVPYIVGVTDGIPRFSFNDEIKRVEVIRERRCGQCGEPLEYWIAFIGGAQIVRSRLSEEPGMHRECAEYAAAVCPYLSRPDRPVRGQQEAPGERSVIVPWSAPVPRREPTAIILTRGYRPYQRGPQLLAKFDRPTEIRWIGGEAPSPVRTES